MTTPTFDPLAKAAMIARCRWDPTEVVTDRTVELNSNGDELLLLPSLHVTDVSAVQLVAADGTITDLIVGPADGAQVTWREDGDGLLLTYDPRLAEAFAAFSPDAAPPPIWEQFDALAHAPLMAVRGANSDILSAQTVAAMRERRGSMETLEVPDQGHTPLLAEPGVIGRIAAFVASCDRERAAGN